MNVLVIDDDSDFLFLIRQKLKRNGHNVYTATNGLKALDELESHKTDLVISDVIMRDTPIMSLTCTLKRLYPQMPLILISGADAEPLVKNSLALGADEFIPKPLDMPRLLSSMKRLATA
jgi:DNA-binding NtrC family response regulator